MHSPWQHPRGHGGLAGGSVFGMATCICSLAHVLLALQPHGCPACSRGVLGAGSKRGAQLRARQLFAAGCMGATLRGVAPALLGKYLPSAVASGTDLSGEIAQRGGATV